MMELDWEVGQILDKLDELGIADDTVVLFTSTMGPRFSAMALECRRRAVLSRASTFRRLRTRRTRGVPCAIDWAIRDSVVLGLGQSAG